MAPFGWLELVVYVVVGENIPRFENVRPLPLHSYTTLMVYVYADHFTVHEPASGN